MTIYKQDRLRFLAESYINNPEYTFEDIKEKDITEIFWKQYRTYFKKKTLVVMNWNGHTTDGKSTGSALLVEQANKILGHKMKADYILGNQQEYAYWVQNHPQATNMMIQIDEWSDLANTGANSSLEQAYLQELSNIHAQMFVHRSYCSPKEMPDKNTILQFEVASKNNGITVCYVYYVLTRGGNSIDQLIGHIVLDVRNVIKAKWYKQYRLNKFKKMKLLREHNIIHERDLFYASAIREIIKHFIGYTQMGKQISVRSITAKAEIYCTKKGIRLTMLGIDYSIVNPVKTVLDLYTDTVKIKQEVEKLKRTLLNNKCTDREYTKMRIEKLNEQYNLNFEDINYYRADLEKKEQLFEEYKKIK